MICNECNRDREKYAKGLCCSCYDRSSRRKGTCKVCGDTTCRPSYELCISCHNKVNKPHLGHPHSQETRDVIRRNTPVFKAEHHHMWSGGKDRFWKNRAKERDNFECQKCGMSDLDIMVVDHIIPKSVRPDLSCDLNNLMTLCPNCHARKTITEKRNKVYKLGFQTP